MIPEKAVQAAATAAVSTPLDTIHPSDRAYWLATARDMLEAAQPYLKETK